MTLPYGQECPGVRRRVRSTCSPSSWRTAAKRAPLYARLSAGIAADDELAGLLLDGARHAAPTRALFAACTCCCSMGPTTRSPATIRTSPPDPDPGDPLPAFRCVLSGPPGRASSYLLADAEHADQRDRPVRAAAPGVRTRRRRGRAR